MADTDWNAFTDASYPLDTDVLLLARGGGGVNIAASAFAHKGVDGGFAVDRIQVPNGGAYIFNAYYDGAWRNKTTGQGGGVLSAQAGDIVAYTGTSPGSAGSVLTIVERMRIRADGQVIVGSTGDWASAKLGARATTSEWGFSSYNGGAGGGGAILTRVDSTAAALLSCYYGTSQVGQITTNGSSVAYNTTSDYRQKDDLKPLTGALDRILALPVYDFRWKATGERARGFLAHEYGAQIAGGTAGTRDAMKDRFEDSDILDRSGNPIRKKVGQEPDLQGIDQSKAVPDLVCAIQELAVLVYQQASRIEALEAKLAK